jgi:hypothetical protein
MKDGQWLLFNDEKVGGIKRNVPSSRALNRLL